MLNRSAVSAYGVAERSLPDFRAKTTKLTALAGLAFLTPFSINNLVQQRLLLGFGSGAIVLILVWLAWKTRNGNYTRSSLLLFPPILTLLVMSIQEQGIIGVLWTYPAIVALFFIFPERWSWGIIVVTLAVIIPQAASVLEDAVALRAGVTLVVVSVFAIVAVRVIETQQKRLEVLIATDHLTGVFNRSLLTKSLEQAVGQSHRSGVPVTLVAIDLDHFKSINDSLGHDNGDKVLVGVATILTVSLRTTDMVFRLGGEEFAVLLFNTAGQAAVNTAEKLRSAISTAPLLEGRSVTASFGVAEFEPGDDPETWLSKADGLLYEAKNQGRDCVIFRDPAVQATSLLGGPE